MLHRRIILWVNLCLCVLLSTAHGTERLGDVPANYVPDPEIEQLIQQANDSDKVQSRKAIAQLASAGSTAERAINYHMLQETTPERLAPWAELLSQCGTGRLGYRVTLSLQPDGSGMLTLWSDRALLAECLKKHERLLHHPEPAISDEELHRNPYALAKMIDFIDDDKMKFMQSHVEPGSSHASGELSFRNFDALNRFAKGFDTGGYYMLNSATLTDSSEGVRSYRFAKQREGEKGYLSNLLLFHDIRWEFVLEFNGHIVRHNASRSEGNRLIWSYNCLEMLSGSPSIEFSYDAMGLAPRPTLPQEMLIPPVAQGNHPTAILPADTVRIKVSRRGGEAPKDVPAKYKLALDGRNSLPRGALTYQWVQTSGLNLKLDAKALARELVYLRIFEAGEYQFALTVSAHGEESKPAYLRVIVEPDDEPIAAVTPPAPKAIEKPIEAPKPEPEKRAPEKTEVAMAPKPPVTPLPPPIEKHSPEKHVEPPAPPAPPTPAKPAKPEEKPEVALPKAVEPAPNPAQKGDPEKLHAEGAKLLKEMRYADAKKVLLEAQKLKPDDDSIAYDAGVALIESDDYAGALSRFQQAARSGENAEALMYVGHCLTRLNSLDDASDAYRRGAELGKERVYWEPLWQLGNTALKGGNSESALRYLVDAEKQAVSAGVKDFRLLRDIAVAMHNTHRDDEALVRLKGLQELGYTPNPDLMKQVQEGAKTAAKTPEPVAKTSPPLNREPEPKKTVQAPAPPPVPVPANPVEVKRPEKVAAVPPPAKPVERVKPEPKESVVAAVRTDDKPPVPVAPQAEKKDPKPQPVRTITPTPAPVKKRKPEPKRAPRKPLPPVPPSYDEALAAGLRAFDTGAKLLKENTADSKLKAQDCWDEAEAMLRGAWGCKPGDERVVSAFRDLAEYTGAIALVKNTRVQTKVKGLVVLDAEASIVPRDRPIYCCWEQIFDDDADDLGLRPEMMAQKKVGFRIFKAGTYRFELAVSDGIKGGNPVTVTVEVGE